MKLEIRKVVSKTDMDQFLKLPWKIYKGNKCWVPPLINDLKESLDPDKNPTLHKTIHELYLAFGDGKPVGRIYAGIDMKLNKAKNINMAYFSLFECINDHEAAKLLFDTASEWARQNGADCLKGPVSITGPDGDEYKGLLVNCFDRPPVLMNSYNPPYYAELIERYGFAKDYDVFAYYLSKENLFKKDPTKIIEYAQKRYGFRVDPINLDDIENEAKAIKQVMDVAIPEDWPDLIPPTLDEIMELSKKLVPMADPRLIPIARHGNDPVGFGLALPDYNQILIHLNGRITPLAALKYLWYKRKINGARMFVMFVVPEFRSKGVSFAIYHRVFSNGMENGYIWGEGSTIGETNIRMRTDIESAGAQHYKTYRIFKKELL